MKKGYLKVFILIFFAMIIFSGNSYGLELKPIQKEMPKSETKVEFKEEPEKKETVILFTIEEVAEDETDTEQEDCSAISDAKNQENKTNENNKPTIREIVKKVYSAKIKENEEKIKIGTIIEKIISKVSDGTENFLENTTVSNDKREKRQYKIDKVRNLLINPIDFVLENTKNNLLYVQKYADNQKYNRLSC